MSLGKKKILSQGAAGGVVGTDNFAPTIYTGNGTTKTVSSSLGFKPDMVWNKSRSASFPPYITDSVRGTGNVLRSSESDAQSSGDGVSSFDSNGFKVSGGGSNQNNGDYASWAWKAGGSAIQNNDGTINGADCLVSANTDAGFSICKYEGNGSQNATIGHGLASPKLTIVKNIGQGDSWFVGSTLLGTNEFMELNTNGQRATNSDLNYQILSTTFKTTSSSPHHMINNNGENYIMYTFADVDNYQKIGTYTGSSSEHSVPIGFAPRFIMIKKYDGSGNWRMYDSARDGSSVPRRVNHNLQANEVSAEYDSSGDSAGYFHITSTGLLFYTGNTNPDVNSNGSNYLYLAIA